MSILALSAALLAFVQPAPGGPAPSAAIAVSVTGVPSSAGVVHVGVCTAETFLKDCPWSADAPAVAGTTIVTVPGVPPGRYAVQAFHDANRDGKVDRNPLGIPKEAIGFSNNAKVRLKGPHFTDAAFDHGGEAQQITLRLHRF